MKKRRNFEGNLRWVLENTIALYSYFMKERFLIAFALAVWSVLPALAQNPANSDELFAEATKLGKPVLLVFSGSDWCMPCIRLKKKVLEDSAFKRFTSEKLLIYTADFPQKKKLSQSQVADNELLASKFNTKGFFPHVVLLKPDQTILGTLPVTEATPELWIKNLNAHLSQP